MAAIERGIGTKNNKLICTGESFYADYKLMFGETCRYANKSETSDGLLPIDNIPFTSQLLDWASGSLDTTPLTSTAISSTTTSSTTTSISIGLSPAYEFYIIFVIVLLAVSSVIKRRK